MKSMKFHGDKVFFGTGSIEMLTQLEGDRAFVVTGGTTIKKMGYLDRVFDL